MSACATRCPETTIAELGNEARCPEFTQQQWLLLSLVVARERPHSVDQEFANGGPLLHTQQHAPAGTVNC
jgi:hypothetical protein